MYCERLSCAFFFFNDTPTTEIYTLSLHAALPIYRTLGFRSEPKPVPLIVTVPPGAACAAVAGPQPASLRVKIPKLDRKSTRLNSSHGYISYAVFCLKKKR